MSLHTIKNTEQFQFTNAAELADWLNAFNRTSLLSVIINHGDSPYLTIHWETEVLSDDSEVNNIRIA